MDLNFQPSSSKKIPMTTFDGVSFEVDVEVAMKMEAVRSFFEDYNSQEITKIPLPNVKKYGKFTMEAKAYDNQYLEKLDNDAIKELLLAANYLNVKSLLDFLNQGIANRVMNKSVEYVREYFEIENDFTPEEEEAIRQENPWAWEDIDED
ncbi:SKP1-like protein 14 [Senna tora]|uniref:SKP1-like protein n=1 Tax=Senna tora TaxID=362788 RepID=A0A834WYC2_9FABA|nr:SKP1-like protein 14 [Senna tora]